MSGAAVHVGSRPKDRDALGGGCTLDDGILCGRIVRSRKTAGIGGRFTRRSPFSVALLVANKMWTVFVVSAVL